METATATNIVPELFYDPFAEEGEEMYDADILHKELEARYIQNEIEHDYTSDQFVKDTEAVMMTAHFNRQFDAMQSIMQRMHELCGEDHNLQQAMSGSDVMSSYDRHDDHAGHDHVPSGYNKAFKTNESKKKDKKKVKLSLYDIMLAIRKTRQKKK